MNKIWSFITKHAYEIIGMLFCICAISFLMFTIYFWTKSIEEVGGVRAIIVESGKELKLLSEDINRAYEKERNNPYK